MRVEMPSLRVSLMSRIHFRCWVHSWDDRFRVVCRILRRTEGKIVSVVAVVAWSQGGALVVPFVALGHFHDISATSPRHSHDSSIVVCAKERSIVRVMVPCVVSKAWS